jgi:aminopeptidase N
MFKLLKPIGLVVSGLLLIPACKVNKNEAVSNNITQNNFMPPVVIKPNDTAPLRRTETQSLDIEHMDLEVSFNYQQQFVYGKATLTCKPYFYEFNHVELDAKGFDLNRVALVNDDDTLNLKYDYNGSKLLVWLDKVYTREDRFVLYIDYVAKPNQLKSKKGVAITSDKGLYFINPTGNDGDKPRQIWTQGEPQSNSCWFPTVDIPNEKITHNIAITVEDKDITLSNGELMMSKHPSPGMRTDYWKQTLPHAPYLVMLAVGEFAQVKDYWRDSIEVDYYVEPAYKQYAKMVFGNTPEMIEVFSKKLGVDYPWNKYAQIVVRDFVSGAMENTSAVVHYDALQHDAREHLDQTNEDIIAHELFHHWFGDLVTCESWSNLPLNESFATYGEYIWDEHKYGLMEADLSFYANLKAYLATKTKHKVLPIRYHYHNRDDMFDVVSYQKGSYILHMLRNMIGDDAFFKSLNLYLTTYAYKTAELANLRMAFEEVTGQDLNWFFDQWFFKAGHPVLEYTYQYSADRKQVDLQIEQKQQTEAYRLPILVDVYTQNGVKRELVTVNSPSTEVTFSADEPILFVNVDAQQTLLAHITDNKTADEYKWMIQKGPRYMDKHYAVNGWIGTLPEKLSDSDKSTIQYLLNHEFWGIRGLGLTVVSVLDSVEQNGFLAQVKNAALTDNKASNREKAVAMLMENDAKGNVSVFNQTVNDSAYSVVGTSLQARKK